MASEKITAMIEEVKTLTSSIIAVIFSDAIVITSN